MKKTINGLMLLTIPLLAMAQEPGLTGYYYKRLEGTITLPAGDLAVTMNLLVRDREIGGSYYYDRVGAIIDLSGIIKDDGRILIRETAADSVTGIFKGRLISTYVIKGVWQDPESTASYPFLLRETYPEGSALCLMRHFDRKIGGGQTGAYGLSCTWPAVDRFPDPGIQDMINGQLAVGNDTMELEKSAAADYAELKASYQDDTVAAYYYTRQWEKNKISRIVVNGGHVLSLETFRYEYTGGAHPNSSFSLLSYDLRTGRPIALKDLLADNGRERFIRIAEEIFRKSRGLGPEDDLDSAGFWFDNGQFAVNENYQFTPAGIRFIYNPYEITSYAAGPIELLVPYARIKTLLKKDHPLRDWIK